MTLPSDRPGNDGLRSRLPSRARHARILAMLRAEGGLSVTQAASDLGVSDMTLRRDLMELEAGGALTRVHGGAVAAKDTHLVEEPSFEQRMRQGQAGKMRIAAEAAQRVSGCRALAIDVGTTTLMLAKLLQPSAAMKVFTSSVRVAMELAGRRGEVYLAGGRVREGELAVGGPSALAQFGALWFDAAVIGASGLTVDGLYDYSIEDTELKRIYIERSTLKIALCDSSKALQPSLVRICTLSEIDVLITDAALPESLARALAQAKVEVAVV